MKRTILRYFALAALLGSVAWLVSEPGYHPVIVLIGSLATFIASETRLSSVPNLAGHWEYEVTTGDKEFSHKGDCDIHQEGLKVRIQGVRRYTCSLEAKRKICKAVDIPWGSDWAQICDDEVLRFDYHIAIAEPRRGGKYIEAICCLKLTSKRPKEMAGNYYMLPPFHEATLNAKWGSVVFRKLKDGAQLLPPDIHGPEDELHEGHIG
jgi:hypothetical protein